jgi:SET domain-containing protein
LESVRLYEKQLCWGHPHLAVQRSEIEGQGLFAGKPIPESTVVARLGGRKVTTAELKELLRNPPVDTITLDDDEHLVLPSDPRPVIAYGNHSCNPNLWWIDAITLEARRNIAAGGEVTSDYGTSTDDLQLRVASVPWHHHRRGLEAPRTPGTLRRALDPRAA